LKLKEFDTFSNFTGFFRANKKFAQKFFDFKEN